ncbi:MAG: hypothetical protein K8S13_10095 [Desulfobacula sp.]|uniref:hypothetical protein n=1 Tax=Desulfobacula sp. TaxID=2593537 RepID=UPI0025C5D731|nr:hypothetical protein [Desulfobacula sp.]MCD4720192.1 hypothetical protein [Desulfobacula sp.]
MKKILAGLITGLFCLCIVPTTNAALFLNPPNTENSKTEATVILYGSRDRNILYPPSVPFAGEHVNAEGGETSYASYNFNQSRFIIDFDQAGTTTSDYYGTELMGWIRFGVDEETPYNIDGFFNTYGNRYKVFSVSLYNENGSSLFGNDQRSYKTTTQEFELGKIEGDLSNTLTGDQSGFLQPNNNYVLSYWVFLYNEHDSQPPDGATGTGNITLNFNPNSCFWDIEPISYGDGDVDGSDLKEFVSGFGGTSGYTVSALESFAGEFGRTDCFN